MCVWGGAPDLDLVDVLVADGVEVVVVLQVPHLSAPRARRRAPGSPGAISLGAGPRRGAALASRALIEA